MRAILPGWLLIPAKVQPGFMHQGRRLKCLTRSFVSHLVRRHSAQFVINQREQLIGGFRVAVFDGLEDLGDVTHGRGRSVCLGVLASRRGCASSERATSARRVVLSQP